MQTISEYQQYFSEYLERQYISKEPKNLYEPISYILQLGGKRLRPVLVLMSSEIFGTSYTKALDAALAVEVFHNFSLIHDDIMDDAPLRRGEETVHEKWDLNTGILSGDAMLIRAYQLFENYDSQIFKELAQLFSITAIQVCEGQQYDIDFETRENVTIAEYIKMIEFKTAVLVGAALKMGAIVAGVGDQEKALIYDFGRLLGLAFQLQDDYLDAFGDPKSFGKQVGGDIIENKKTFLFLKAFEHGTPKEKKELLGLFSLNPENPSQKIELVKSLYEDTGARELTRKEIEKYTDKAFSVLKKLDITEDRKVLLRSFGENLMNRSV
ncbi:polyprenyl synthetase family protein [Aquimarina intermedia]|uniref:polyprenyl synthetase family protein n=1 Tax=Aquimarina intermedia TaxID=350814 RepID=UPI0011E65CAD|nr:polyprenyl synthetase family protein [Aquimarina intermedia]